MGLDLEMPRGSLQQRSSETVRTAYERLRARLIAPAGRALGGAAWRRAETAAAALRPEEVFDLALGARTGSARPRAGAGADVVIRRGMVALLRSAARSASRR